ncbi:MAG: hypothetical protein EAZ73_09000 [Oscillatoriales cyanobacterium]|uniref:hypothetical protein n=1 Tax=unclassified Microcoleus TaxID=2642155 RepID=UPI001D8247A4|nr:MULTISPECIES: hypothetical protein [unclassified Microcoleus]TAF00885.1 MAG: hypothetical protein EAZ79_01600 [Oscillatoriales cyanobacterium]MCC3459774.1 hypothetical protein [Microcoleus sp. PH2017_11_PCY_U_A]MCC3478207.1 hypothetical protein [Microcoleus sp. PH2017_12_PCY_D_A]TAF21357.1 MAG: hypothetical protein EAZ73_09000 [Oscillatoriales cyanobacterium]TAF39716.1 MAG: hypothetical protein EAZ69_00345 [Oscillatoriales cyanobacterium]
MKLNQTKQCKTCPWKISTTVTDIPNYSLEQHINLSNTIADDTGNLCGINRPLVVMGCHHSTVGKEYECIGWLHNQLGNGNNIPLRLRMMCCENANEIEIDGKQKHSFSDTFQ